MGIFGKKEKKSKEEEKEELEKRKLKEFLEKYYKKVYVPEEEKEKIEIASREYKIFKEREKGKLTLYEKLANFSEKLLNIKPGKDGYEKLQKEINFCDLRITPTGVMSLAVLTIFLSIFLASFFIIIGLPPQILLITLVSGLILGYYAYIYPSQLVKRLRIQLSSQIILAVLYMVIAMRVSPNLENALRFAASNTSGVLAWNLRRLIWDIEMGKYYSANEAITEYVAKWKTENEEFAEALRLLRDSQYQAGSRAQEMLDQALEIILEGTKVRMKHYIQELKLPITVIHMFGILLPVLGTVTFPLIAIFLSEAITPLHFFIGYDIALPLIVWLLMRNTLQKRPVTFSQVDVSKHPDLPPKGEFYVGSRTSRIALPALPFGILVAGMFIIPALMFFNNLRFQFKSDLISLIMSSLIIFGIGMGISVYFYLSYFQRIKIQKDIQETETEFEVALFQLGNRIVAGTPIELAMEKSLANIKDLKIANLFKICLRNMKTLGLTFKEALFDPKVGAIRYYPSTLIRNIMRTIADISRKGVSYAAEAMLTISRYLKNIKETQEYIRELLEETISSINFQAIFLTPIICGLVVSMAQVMINVLLTLASKLASISVEEATMGTTGVSPFTSLLNINSVVPAEIFQLIVGIYLIEVIILMSIFLTKITQGENKELELFSAGKTLLVGVIIYILILIITASTFGGLISIGLENV